MFPSPKKKKQKKEQERAMQSTETAVQPTETAMQSTETAVQSTETTVQPTETAMQSTETAMKSTETAMQSTEKTTSNAWRFSYNVARTLKRRCFNLTWNVIEKGYNKSALGKEYKISHPTIKMAASFLQKLILETPCYQSSLLRKIGVHVYFKKELNQHMNSIQARGVIYTLLQLTDEQKRNGVITISTGYFAQTLCYFGQKFKIPVTVVMLKLTAQEIVDKCQYLGATVIVRGDNIVEVHNIALQIARRKCLCYLDGNDHPNMIIGQATLGLEIFEQLDFGKTIDAVILPTTVDGCGVTATIAMAIRKSNSNIKIIEVQTTVQDLLTNNVRQKCHKLNIPEQNLYVGYSHNLFQDIRLYLFDRLVLVSETLIRKAANFLLATENFNDYYAAIALAGILTGNLHDLIKEKSVLIPLFGKKDDSNNFMDKSSLQPGSSTSSS
ncbi:PREDICTED: L-threonine dehydratase catabolic TdcB-like [Trachymyrmex cornetzi]|uniref:L-threonine dehydratase catabolic TdcB-like n=1 Tax=Trachymyrmex cornetzi TaxID=471704 RepID=UPI00084EFBDB|nr:PREDICTED: L-threonine dehydratase catabolic TdcB-like [Trachymyrmex cornetzi]